MGNLNIIKAFCCGMLLHRNIQEELFNYLKTGRSLNRDRDEDKGFLEEINRLNEEHKFWVRVLTGTPMKITAITDDVSEAVLRVFKEKEGMKEKEEKAKAEAEKNATKNATETDAGGRESANNKSSESNKSNKKNDKEEL